MLKKSKNVLLILTHYIYRLDLSSNHIAKFIQINILCDSLKE